MEKMVVGQITFTATLSGVIPGQCMQRRWGKIPGVWLFPPGDSEAVRTVVGTRGHSVCIPSPMMHLPASAAPTVSHYVSISLDYPLIAEHQLFSLSLTVVVHCLTFGLGAAETPSPHQQQEKREGSRTKGRDGRQTTWKCF